MEKWEDEIFGLSEIETTKASHIFMHDLISQTCSSELEIVTQTTKQCRLYLTET